MSKNHRNITLEIKNCLSETNDDINIEDEKNGKRIIKKYEKHHSFDRKEVARRRWGLLAKALKVRLRCFIISFTQSILNLKHNC